MVLTPNSLRYEIHKFWPPWSLNRHLLPSDKASFNEGTEVQSKSVVGEPYLSHKLKEVPRPSIPKNPQYPLVKRIHSEPK